MKKGKVIQRKRFFQYSIKASSPEMGIKDIRGKRESKNVEFSFFFLPIYQFPSLIIYREGLLSVNGVECSWLMV